MIGNIEIKLRDIPQMAHHIYPHGDLACTAAVRKPCATLSCRRLMPAVASQCQGTVVAPHWCSALPSDNTRTKVGPRAIPGECGTGTLQGEAVTNGFEPRTIG